MSPQLLVLLLSGIGVMGLIGIVVCIMLLYSNARDERVYSRQVTAKDPNINGRELMVINTDKRRYGINLLKFTAAGMIWVASNFMPISIERSTVNAFLIFFFIVAAFINLVLDAKDSRDLYVHGLAVTEKRHEARDLSRDEGRDTERDAHRDLARDAEHDKAGEDK
jgi:hypothetical protein